MDRVLDVEHRGTELFAGLDSGQRNAVIQSLTASRYEGWEPNETDVANLVNYETSVDQGMER